MRDRSLVLQCSKCIGAQVGNHAGRVRILFDRQLLHPFWGKFRRAFSTVVAVFEMYGRDNGAAYKCSAKIAAFECCLAVFIKRNFEYFAFYKITFAKSAIDPHCFSSREFHFTKAHSCFVNNLDLVNKVLNSSAYVGDTFNTVENSPYWLRSECGTEVYASGSSQTTRRTEFECANNVKKYWLVIGALVFFINVICQKFHRLSGKFVVFGGYDRLESCNACGDVCAVFGFSKELGTLLKKACEVVFFRRYDLQCKSVNLALLEPHLPSRDEASPYYSAKGHDCGAHKCSLVNHVESVSIRSRSCERPQARCDYSNHRKDGRRYSKGEPIVSFPAFGIIASLAFNVRVLQIHSSKPRLSLSLAFGGMGGCYVV